MVALLSRLGGALGGGGILHRLALLQSTHRSELFSFGANAIAWAYFFAKKSHNFLIYNLRTSPGQMWEALKDSRVLATLV